MRAFGDRWDDFILNLKQSDFRKWKAIRQYRHREFVSFRSHVWFILLLLKPNMLHDTKVWPEVRLENRTGRRSAVPPSCTVSTFTVLKPRGSDLFGQTFNVLAPNLLFHHMVVLFLWLDSLCRISVSFSSPHWSTLTKLVALESRVRFINLRFDPHPGPRARHWTSAPPSPANT